MKAHCKGSNVDIINSVKPVYTEMKASPHVMIFEDDYYFAKVDIEGWRRHADIEVLEIWNSRKGGDLK